ncbi:MAG TPA: uracil-DNA glycosylase [Candidatus Dormibacteraeota bacterium]|jgi:uracil-DNA glycosylase family 4|nr:uracil-DNA glycosylase [Candidatus Dormibacteraeota bacterium]
MAGRRRVLGVANGRTDAGIVIVGLAPGRLGAERTGVPFSGDRSGAMLDSLLARVHLTRRDVFITNAVLCNPQDAAGRNAPPAAAELRRCRDHLAATIAAVDPSLIIALGHTAFAAVLATAPAPLSFDDCRGAPQPWSGRLLAATYHPAPRVVNQPARRHTLLAQWEALTPYIARTATRTRRGGRR